MTPQNGADVEVADDLEELVQRSPLVQLFGDHPKARILSTLAVANRPLNPTSICESANLSRNVWYDHKDDLLATGLVVVDEEASEQAGNSTLFALVDVDEDARTEWLEKLNDWTGAYLRDGSRPTGEDA